MTIHGRMINWRVAQTLDDDPWTWDATGTWEKKIGWVNHFLPSFLFWVYFGLCGVYCETSDDDDSMASLVSSR